MRAIFSILSLLIVLAVVGVLARKQLAAPASTQHEAQPTTATGLPLPLDIQASGDPALRSRQLQQQVQQTVQSQLQARPSPEDP